MSDDASTGSRDDGDTVPLDLPDASRSEPDEQTHPTPDRPAEHGPEERLWPKAPPPYPGWGSPGWHGGAPIASPPSAALNPLLPAAGAHPSRPAPGWHGPPSPGYAPGAWAPQQRPLPTPWAVLVAVSLVVGLVGGILGTVVALAGSDGGSLGTGGTAVDPLPSDPAPLRTGNTSVARVADRLLPSVVQVRVVGSQGSATGSGFVLDERGHVVTNAHVVRAGGDDGISVVLPDGHERTAELIGFSESYDLAVLEVQPDGLRVARLGSSGALRVGQPVVAFGSPLGLTSTVTSGIVSALDRPVTAGGSGESSYINAIQTDAAINPGNSGGPLVDLQGRVVGVNSAIATVGGSLGSQSGNIGVGFAIPIDQVRVTAVQLIRSGVAVYPVIGASVDTGGGEGGAVIDGVEAGSPAEDAGLQEGDRVVRVDGTAVADGIELIVAIRARVPGETVTLEFVRAGDRRSVDVVLGEAEG